jgi:hypothetical protein
MGHLRLETDVSYSSKAGMEIKGSKPRVDMGGSVDGEALSLTLPSRRASE